MPRGHQIEPKRQQQYTAENSSTWKDVRQESEFLEKLGYEARTRAINNGDKNHKKRNGATESSGNERRFLGAPKFILRTFRLRRAVVVGPVKRR